MQWVTRSCLARNNEAAMELAEYIMHLCSTLRFHSISSRLVRLVQKRPQSGRALIDKHTIACAKRPVGAHNSRCQSRFIRGSSLTIACSDS